MMNQPALFEMPAPRGPTEPIMRTAEFDETGKYRFGLTRAWGAGPCILWCGLNPSTADDKVDDPTIKREMRFSFLWGFGSMIKVNFYPFCSSTTPPMFEWLKQAEIDGTPEWNAWVDNLKFIGEALRQCPATPMAAWGNGVSEKNLKFFLEFTDDAAIEANALDKLLDLSGKSPPVQWHCLERTLSGAPRHTLARGKHRIPDNQRPVLWRTS